MKKLGTLFASIVLTLLVIAPASAGPAFTYECRDPSGPPVTFCEVLLDPDIHGGSKGTVLASHTTAGTRTITLPDLVGPHRIAVVAGANVSGGINTSVIQQYTDAAGCPTGWGKVGVQSWWSDTGQDPYFESRHAHYDNICWPVNNKIVTGTHLFTLPFQVHNQPPGAEIQRMRVQVYPNGNDVWACSSASKSPGCPNVFPAIDSNGNATGSATVSINFSNLPTGRLEFRWAIYVFQPSSAPSADSCFDTGAICQLLSSRLQVCNATCSPAFRSGTYQGNGSWYEKDTNPGYVDSRIHSTWPVSTGSTPPPPTPTPVVVPPTPTPTPVPTPTPFIPTPAPTC